MLENKESFFFSGYGSATSIKIHGSLADLKYFAYHINDGKVVAMSSCGTDPIIADFAEYLYEGKSLMESEVTEDPTGWMRNKPKDLLKTIAVSSPNSS